MKSNINGKFMKKVLITGANGYLGSHISKLLSQNGFEIYALIYEKIEPKNNWYSNIHKIIEGDLADESLYTELEKYDFNSIIHLASLDHHQSETTIDKLQKINVEPCWKLLDIFTKKNLKNFIYFSTQQVIGKTSETIISETTSAKPNNKYGLTHLLCENIVNFYNTKTETNSINLRLSNGYGEPIFQSNNCWSLVVNDLCKAAYKTKKIILNSDGTPQKDFINVTDIASAVEFILNKNMSNILENTFNLSSGFSLNLAKLAIIVQIVYSVRYNKKIPVFINKNEQLLNLKNFNLGAERIKITNKRLESLGFKSKIIFIDGINKIFDYLEKL